MWSALVLKVINMNINWDRSLVLGLVKLYILAILNENKKHGYEIIKELEKKTKGCCNVSVGSIYPALKELEAMKLIKRNNKRVEGRKRIIYEIAEEGKNALNEGIKKWHEFNDATEALFKNSTI